MSLKGEIKKTINRVMNLFYPPPTCWEITNRFFVLSDGSVTTCCMDGLGANTYGNINIDISIDESLKSEKFKKLTNNLLSSPICVNCPFKKSNPTKSEVREYKANLKKGPEGAQLEVAGRCNYACDQCFANVLPEKRDPMPDLDVMFKWIEPTLAKLKYINCFNFGEPFLNPKFPDFLLKCRNANKNLSIGISTNGMLLTQEKAKKVVEAKVSWMMFSLHGAPGTENMLKYSNQGADYEKVLKNIKMLKDVRDSQGLEYPKIIIRAILFNWNDSDELMDKFRADMNSIGIQAAKSQAGINTLSEDHYHWILDASSPCERSSQRFFKGNELCKELINRNEFAFDEKEVH